MSMPLRFGMCVPERFWTGSLDQRIETVARIADAGFHHMYMADHVSFRDGHGTDGFVEIAALSQMHPTIGVMISIYLLPLRHPLPVARQLATMHKIAPGRMLFGVGIGGDDRHEVEVCGVDPRTRGRRTNESLGIIRALMRGDTVDLDGEFFTLRGARIKPRIEPPVPILVGGRSDAALLRTALHGDGWIGVWCSPARYGEAAARIDAAAREHGRHDVAWQHGYQPWAGIADDRATARALVARAMENFYHVPFEKFERYVPYGTPEDVAAGLQPYVDAGCRVMNLKVVAASDEEEIGGATEVARQLRLPA
ncbi:MAG: LLM class flavin-dependent oxidoreductase [Pseudomonadales bacterium]|nr:LLM class flavin-dependent oxidoreductase [Pseudomonadales bacterium]